MELVLAFATDDGDDDGVELLMMVLVQRKRHGGGGLGSNREEARERIRGNRVCEWHMREIRAR